jgi:hypothetical protein
MGLLSSDGKPPRRSAAIAGALAVVVVVVVGAVGYWYVSRPELKPEPTPTPAKPQAGAAGPRTPPKPTPSALATPPARAAARRASPTPALAAPLHVEADVDDASVFVDRRFVGKAPLDVREVEPGTRRVQVAAEGYATLTEEVEIGSAPVRVVARLKEVRLDEALVVVHKHGVGSCRGTLRATTAGLSFEAQSGKDSFSAPFSSLEPLEVDYLRKNLRLSAGGKTYNFTVDGPNADPLLVFQRHVEAARKKL